MDTDERRFRSERDFRAGSFGSANSDEPKGCSPSSFLASYLCPSVSLCGFV